MRFKKGLCSISFRSLSAQEIIDSMKKADLDVIEWGSDIHAPCNDYEKLMKIVKLQQESGIKCCSYGTYFKLGVTPIEELEDYINAAKILGTNILRLWCGDKNSQDYSIEQKEILLNECKAAADIAKKNGAILCLECHNNTYTNKKESALELMQVVNSKHFRMYWQPNQYRSEQENLKYAKMLAPYIVNIHVFNWKGEEKYPLRDAFDIWEKYLDCYDGNKNLLLEFMPDGKIESLKTEAEALKEIAK